MPTIILAAGRERSLARRHPWVFSGSVARVDGSPGSGDPVQLRDEGGQFMAWGAISPESKIRVRIWSWREADRVDAAFIDMRIAAAIERRGPFNADAGLRLVNAEADGIPGLIVDRYADVAVVQLLSAGVERWRSTIFESVRRYGQCGSVFERSDAEVRTLEGLAPRSGHVAGPGFAPIIEFAEGSGATGCRYLVDVRNGHKTGFYLDQAINRAKIGALAGARSMLNCFCYTGGFSIAALKGGAKRVVSIDSSAGALDLARRNAELNGVPGGEWIEDDVFKRLRIMRDARELFDLIVLDPPKFAPTVQHIDRAARAYKDINLLAFQLLRPGGLLATFSCSGAISPSLFQSIVAGAAQDAHVEVEVLEQLRAAEDHPVVLAFPEGEYLKGILVRRR
ncbi:MAG: class I SAM-dependent rRNA methyltransferase [Burkholderiales bacterium]